MCKRCPGSVRTENTETNLVSRMSRCYSSLAMKLPASVLLKQRVTGETLVAVLGVKSALPSSSGDENSCLVDGWLNARSRGQRVFDALSATTSDFQERLLVCISSSLLVSCFINGWPFLVLEHFSRSSYSQPLDDRPRP